MLRPICKTCKKTPAAVNYVAEGVRHYRSECAACIRKGKKLKKQKPAWALAGYKMKPKCEMCGFTAKFQDQLSVHYIDNNHKNNNKINLRTVCLNCLVELSKSVTGWRRGDLTPDL